MRLFYFIIFSSVLLSCKKEDPQKETKNTNVAPVAVDDYFSAQINKPLSLKLLKNDSDEDSDSIFILSVTQPNFGEITQSRNEVVYTTSENFTGFDSFTYTISDGLDSVIANVSIIIENSEPIVVEDSTGTRYETMLEVDVLENDDDNDGNILSLTQVYGASGGEAEIINGLIRYTPNQNYSGTDTLTYEVTDGNLVSTGELFITVLSQRHTIYDIIRPYYNTELHLINNPEITLTLHDDFTFTQKGNGPSIYSNGVWAIPNKLNLMAPDRMSGSILSVEEYIDNAKGEKGYTLISGSKPYTFIIME